MTPKMCADIHNPDPPNPASIHTTHPNTQSHEGLAQRELIASLFDDWNAALATKDPQQVANLYAHDAVLLPTVSNEVGASVCPGGDK